MMMKYAHILQVIFYTAHIFPEKKYLCYDNQKNIQILFNCGSVSLC